MQFVTDKTEILKSRKLRTLKLNNNEINIFVPYALSLSYIVVLFQTIIINIETVLNITYVDRKMQSTYS